LHIFLGNGKQKKTAHIWKREEDQSQDGSTAERIVSPRMGAWTRGGPVSGQEHGREDSQWQDGVA